MTLQTLSPTLTPVDLLFLVSAATVIVALILGRLRLAAPLLVAGYALQFALLLETNTLIGTPITAALTLEVLGHPIHWRYDAVSWFFAMITIGSAFACSWYASGEWMRAYRASGRSPHALQVALALNVLAMLLLLGSADLLALFIGWELVSWASFMLMAVAGGIAGQTALRYLVYGFSGGMAILGGLAMIYTLTGSFQYADLAATIPSLTNGQLWLLLVLIGGGFAVKLGLVPFHLWQPGAYAETPGPGAAFLGSISARMGLYGFMVVFVGIVGITRLMQMDVPYTLMSARELLAWVAAATIVLATFVAIQQNDARYLLAWSGVGQGGYMLLGVLVGTSVGSAGGLLHVFNYAITQAALLLAVFAIVHRTGTPDLNRLGGLFTRMPLTFVVVLIGIISLAGLPPMAGFVSKWMIYRSLIAEQMPFLFVATVIGTLGTILYVYKLIHNLFLGQLRIEHEQVTEAPVSMLAPMLGLSALIFLAGITPGNALGWVASVQAAIGLPVLTNFHLGGLETPQATLDMLWVVGVMLAGFGIGALIFFGIGGRHKRVHQLDNYAGGHFLTADVRYQYSDPFYPGLMHLIGGWYRGTFRWLEQALTNGIGTLAFSMNGFFRTPQPLTYGVVAGSAVLIWALF
jgi:NADH-quinone oxidoreductase subunit M